MLSVLAFRQPATTAERPPIIYWFPTDDAGNVTSTVISTSATEQPCMGSSEQFCALGFPEDSPLIEVIGSTVTLLDNDPLLNGIPAKKAE